MLLKAALIVSALVLTSPAEADAYFEQLARHIEDVQPDCHDPEKPHEDRIAACGALMAYQRALSEYVAFKAAMDSKRVGTDVPHSPKP